MAVTDITESGPLPAHNTISSKYRKFMVGVRVRSPDVRSSSSVIVMSTSVRLTKGATLGNDRIAEVSERKWSVST